ncbi:MAG TPA: flagellar basal-body MS-ring/collar protein FliF [Chloroflexota bacterium]|jgi:flagellar M-ring protein FliF
MDALNPVLQPILRVWGGLSRVQRVGLGVILAAALGLFFVVSTVGRTPDSAIAFSGLSPEDGAMVVEKLKTAKIPYELAEGGVVRVPSGQLQEARLALAGSGLNGKPTAGSGFELFDQNSFGQTEFTQKVNYQRALENELARSIGRLEAVESARVHLVLPQPSLFTTQQKDATASVILKLKAGKRFDTAQARSIANLVASSVEGLKPQNLTIVDVNGNMLSGDDNSPLTGLSNKQLDQQRGYEATVERDLQALLDRVLGSGKAAVRVSATMNWDQVEQTNESYTPGDPTQTPVRTNHEISETTTNGAAGAGGVPGTQANNGTVPTYQGAGAGTGGATTKTERDTTYELNKSIQKIVTAPGTVKRQSVSVMLDDDPNNPNAALIQNVQNAINAAAGIDATRGDVLTVTSLAFNREELQSTQAAMADAAQKDQVMSYARLGVLALGPLLMLIVLFFVLSRGKSKKDKTSAAAELIAAQAATAQPAQAATPDVQQPVVPGRATKPFMPNAQPITEDPQKVYIREQIQTLGKSNPATVAQLIQTWMDEDRRN